MVEKQKLLDPKEGTDIRTVGAPRLFVCDCGKLVILTYGSLASKTLNDQNCCGCRCHYE